MYANCDFPVDIQPYVSSIHCMFKFVKYIRRQQCLAREHGIQAERDERYLMQKLMQDQHKQRILSQLDHERQRQINDMEKVAQTREAKKQINTQIRVKVENNQVGK